MNYVVMDTSSIVLWVSVCVRNMSVNIDSVKDFTWQHFKVSYMESL